MKILYVFVPNQKLTIPDWVFWDYVALFQIVNQNRKRVKKALVILVVLSISIAGCTIDPEWERVGTDEFEDAINNNPAGFLLDVRTTSEWNSDGYIEGATLIPHDSLEDRSDELPEDMDDLILLYCRSGNRSQKAAQTLMDMGYTNLIELDVGINGWKSDGKSVVYP